MSPISWYAKNSETKPRGLYFSRALFEGLIFGGAYIRRGVSTEGNLRFKIDCASLINGRKLPCVLCFTLYLRAISEYKPPRRGLYLEGRFDGGCFALRVWGGLYLEGLIFGILRYCVVMLGEVFIIIFKSVKENVCEGSKCQKVAYLMEQESKL